MATFKENIYVICKEVAEEFADWSFVSGSFKNKTLKHTNLLIYLGFAFQNGSTYLQPSIHIENKKTMKLHEKLIGFSSTTSILRFGDVSNELAYVPEKYRITALLHENKLFFLNHLESTNRLYLGESVIDIKEAKSVLRAVLQDGIHLIERYYDLSSEKKLLKMLPPHYTPRDKLAYEEYEGNAGVMMCIVRLVLGDFDFVQRYHNGEIPTAKPKRMADVDKIIAALPELQKRYEKTDCVI